MASDELAQMLGRIEGKLDQVGKSFDRHIDDDVRRFTEIHKKLDEQASDINKAKGAKGVIVWMAGVVGAVAAALVSVIAKSLGIHL